MMDIKQIQDIINNNNKLFNQFVDSEIKSLVIKFKKRLDSITRAFVYAAFQEPFLVELSRQSVLQIRTTAQEKIQRIIESISNKDLKDQLNIWFVDLINEIKTTREKFYYKAIKHRIGFYQKIRGFSDIVFKTNKMEKHDLDAMTTTEGFSLDKKLSMMFGDLEYITKTKLISNVINGINLGEARITTEKYLSSQIKALMNDLAAFLTKDSARVHNLANKHLGVYELVRN